MPDAEMVRQLLTQRGDLNQYRVKTLYVDTPEGTWSRDPGKPRFRLRIYDGKDSFLEVKLRVPGSRVYVKKRQPSDGVPENMVSLGQSRYTRQEWETGMTRVTIDTGVSTQGRSLPGFVVETKLAVGDPLPDWLMILKPYEQPQFSKWRWVNG